jgi:hypothetical protein
MFMLPGFPTSRMLAWLAVASMRKQGRMFFFEKKNQKTFIRLHGVQRVMRGASG